MIQQGVLEAPAPKAIFAVHSAPLEVGQIGSVEGLSLPGLDGFTVTVRGEADVENAARASARAIAGISTGQDVEPGSYIAVMFGGSGPGPARGEWVLTGMVRAGSEDARVRAREQIEQELAKIRRDGISFELHHQGLVLPDVVNDPDLVRGSLEAIRAAVGPTGLLEVNEVTPYFGEDFAHYQQRIPGAMYWLGVSNAEQGYNGYPHSPDFVADEEAIFVGARAMAAVLLNFLETH